MASDVPFLSLDGHAVEAVRVSYGLSEVESDLACCLVSACLDAFLPESELSFLSLPERAPVYIFPLDAIGSSRSRKRGMDGISWLKVSARPSLAVFTRFGRPRIFESGSHWPTYEPLYRSIGTRAASNGWPETSPASRRSCLVCQQVSTKAVWAWTDRPLLLRLADSRDLHRSGIGHRTCTSSTSPVLRFGARAGCVTALGREGTEATVPAVLPSPTQARAGCLQVARALSSTVPTLSIGSCAKAPNEHTLALTMMATRAMVLRRLSSSFASRFSPRAKASLGIYVAPERQASLANRAKGEGGELSCSQCSAGPWRLRTIRGYNAQSKGLDGPLPLGGEWRAPWVFTRKGKKQRKMNVPNEDSLGVLDAADPCAFDCDVSARRRSRQPVHPLPGVRQTCRGPPYR